MNFSTVTLKRFDFALQQAISRNALDATFDVRETADRLVATMRTQMFGEQSAVKRVVFPRDWKEAFKARWFPDWALKRWPIVYEVVTFDAKILAPRAALNVAIPPDRREYLIPWIQASRLSMRDAVPIFQEPPSPTRDPCIHCGEMPSLYREDRELRRRNHTGEGEIE